MISKQTLIRKTWEKWLKKNFQLGFSSEVKVPQLGSSRAGKFQLGLITRLYGHPSMYAATIVPKI